MRRHILALLIGLVLGGGGLIGPAQAQQQQIPESVREELRRQGMTVEEARLQAQRLGIDLSNPQQALRRARQLGIPEARIQALLQAFNQQGQMAGAAAGGAQPQLRPTLSGGAVITPDTLLVSELPQTVAIRVRLRSEVLISEVNPFFITAGQQPLGRSSVGGQRAYPGQQYAPYNPTDTVQQVPPGYAQPYPQGQYPQQYAGQQYARGQYPRPRGRAPLADTLRVENVRRVSGTVNNGVWEGRVMVPLGMQPGVMALRVQVTDRDSVQTTLSTNKYLVLRSDRPEFARRDTAKTARDTLQYFGYDLFRTIPDAFQPNAMGPVDDAYIVGPNDALRLTAWGATQFRYDLTVDREGRIFVPNVGQYMVAGKRLDVLRNELREWLSQKYAGLTSDPPTISMDLTVTRMRPIQVYVLGEVRYPGGYTISSASTVFNVLYSVGGPLRRGSLRNVKVIRGGEAVATVDLYDYLLSGYSTDPVRLQSGDYIYIPPREKTVAVVGEVKRPAYYEVKDDETLQDLIDYAGGLTPQAYGQRVHIERIVPLGQRTDPSVPRKALDVDLSAVRAGDRNVPLADADFITVPSILEASSRVNATRINAVQVTGAVYQPGEYEISGAVRTIRDLIEKADGLRGDAYRQQAELVRLQKDLDESSVMLNLNEVMADDPRANIVLRPGDSLHVASVQQLKIKRTVRITGQVLYPGTYTYRDSMTVVDLLFKGGGLTDEEYLKNVFTARADLFRESADGRSERVIPFHLGEALNHRGFADEPLRPGDEIRVYPLSVDALMRKFIEISGAVKDPGQYTYQENMTLKDIIIRAGGFQEGAFLRAVEVTRRPADDARGLRAHTLQVELASTTQIERVSFAVDDTARALQAASEFQLQHRDRVYVRTDPGFQVQETVVVRGEVRFPGEYTLLRDNETLADVIVRAGGVRPTGYPEGGRLFRDSSQVIVEMGRAISGTSESDVILQPGDEIYIPPQPNTVAIRGNVANAGLLKFQPGERVSYYLERAGGTLDRTQDIFLTQASGATFEVDTGWFRRTPEVDDGAVIRVTRKPPEPPGEESFDLATTIRDVTAILSSALTVIVLAQRVGN